MSEFNEEKNEKYEKNEKHEKCLCQNKYFKKFIVVVFGSFIGVYFALSLFTLVHRPPCHLMCWYAPIPMYNQMYGGHHNCPCKYFKDKMKHHEEFKKEIEHKD